MPGQYLQHKDKNQDFIRIERFLPNVDLVRGIGVCHRRLKIRGHDGSIHPFAIQHPAARHCRREERILQLFRHFNGSLSKRKESRRRNLNFHLPLMIPLAPHIRMVQDDPTYISLQGVFEDHCRRNGMSKDDPVLFTMEKMRTLVENKVSGTSGFRSRIKLICTPRSIQSSRSQQGWRLSQQFRRNGSRIMWHLTTLQRSTLRSPNSGSFEDNSHINLRRSHS